MADPPAANRNLACLGCGYRLDHLTASNCPECGRAFDLCDPDTFQRILDDPLRLARLPITEAFVACLALENAGIPATIEQELGGIVGHIDIPRASLWVERADQASAKAVLNELVNRKRVALSWTCPQCAERIEAQFDVCWNCGSERAPACTG